MGQCPLPDMPYGRAAPEPAITGENLTITLRLDCHVDTVNLVVRNEPVPTSAGGGHAAAGPAPLRPAGSLQ